MMHRYTVPLFLLWFLAACSCRIPTGPEENTLSIMTWNVQNLFDAVSSGLEYSEFDPETSDWGEEMLRLRLENLKEVILSVRDNGPDIILLQEVENQAVLDQLNREYLDNSYPYTGAWNHTENAIRCGYLSRLKPTSIHLHFPGEYGSLSLRAVLEIRFSVGGDELILLNNHWKSRSGGVAATESTRILSAKVVSDLLKDLKSQGKKNVIAAGDFNGSSEDYRPGGYQTAQIPIEYVPDTSWLDSLYIAEDPEDLYESEDRAVLFSPWKDIGVEGSYFFQNSWIKLDHFLLTSAFLDGTGWEYDRAVCVNDSWLCDSDGHPEAWQSWKGSGYSDHFPLVLTLIQSD